MSSSLIHLAYLIEISIVLNLTYREIKYVQTGEKLLREIAEIEAEFQRNEIDINSDIHPESKFLKSIFEGVDREAWQGHNRLRKFYKNFLKKGQSKKVVTALIICDLFLLVAFSLIDRYDFFQLNQNAIIWNCGYIFLISSLIIPLYFTYRAICCYEYLFGRPGDPDYYSIVGRINCLKWRILTRYEAIQDKTKKEAETFKVD
jgi:hypothetical protein